MILTTEKARRPKRPAGFSAFFRRSKDGLRRSIIAAGDNSSSPPAGL